MNKNKKTSKNQLKTAIVLWVGIILYSFWLLHTAVSKLKIKLLNIESISEHAKYICNFYYYIAIGFLVLGVVLGLGFAALKKNKSV